MSTTVQKELTIDPEFRDLLPPLTVDERERLEAALKEDGCRDALVVWKGVLLDGHHRYAICRTHQLPYRTVERACVDRDDAKIWILKNQLARRSPSDGQRVELQRKLSDFQRGELVMHLEPLEAAQAKARQIGVLKRGSDSPSCPDEHNGRTVEKLAAIAGISRTAMNRSIVVKKRGSPELQEQVRSGQVSLSEAARRCWEGNGAPVSEARVPHHKPIQRPQQPDLRKEGEVIAVLSALLDEWRQRRKKNHDDWHPDRWRPHGISVVTQTKISNWLDGELVKLLEKLRASMPDMAEATKAQKSRGVLKS